MNAISLAIGALYGLSGVGSATPAFPPGEILALNMADYVASPRPHVPNSASVEAVSTNMVALPRGRFSSAYWGAQTAVLSDGITDPDGGTQAGRYNSAGGDSYFLMSSSPSLAAGTYTMAVTAKRHGATDQTFVMDFYDVLQSDVKDATSVYQRFYHTATVPSGVTLLFFIRSLSAACDIDFVDVALYPGTVTSQNEPPLSGHLYLGATGFDARPTYASGLLDLSNTGYGYLQFPSLSLSAFTSIAVYKETGVAPDFTAILGSYGNYVTLSTSLDSGKGPDAVFGGVGLFENRLATGGIRLAGKGLKVIGHRFGAGASTMFVNDVKLVQSTASPSLPVSVKDFIFGAMQSPDYTGEHQLVSYRFYPTALTDEEYADAYAAAVAQAAETGNIVDVTDHVVASEGDSITADGSSYSRQAAIELSPSRLYVNYAVAGDEIGDLADRGAMLDATLPPLADRGSRKFILSVLIGANDLGTGATAEEFLQDLADYLDARRAAGWYVLLCTILPANSSLINDGRAITNPEMRLWPTGGSMVPGIHADAICDFAADLTYGTDAAALDAAKYPDGVHPSADPTQAALKAIWRDAVNAI